MTSRLSGLSALSPSALSSPPPSIFLPSRFSLCSFFLRLLLYGPTCPSRRVVSYPRITSIAYLPASRSPVTLSSWDGFGESPNQIITFFDVVQVAFGSYVTSAIERILRDNNASHRSSIITLVTGLPTEARAQLLSCKGNAPSSVILSRLLNHSLDDPLPVDTQHHHLLDSVLG